MTRHQHEDSPRPRVGVKPPPGGAVGGCPGRWPGLQKDGPAALFRVSRFDARTDQALRPIVSVDGLHNNGFLTSSRAAHQGDINAGQTRTKRGAVA